MPMFKVYLGNLDSKVTVETLKPLFEPFGDVDEIVIACDAEGKSRGFAIILFRDPLKGQLAVETLAGRKILGRTVVINEAIKKGKKTQPAVRAPRSSPLGPRAFPRVGGFGRGAAGGAGGGSGGGRFVRNPRRLLNQPGMPSTTPGANPGSAGAPTPAASGEVPYPGSGGQSGTTGGGAGTAPGGAEGASATPVRPPSLLRRPTIDRPSSARPAEDRQTIRPRAAGTTPSGRPANASSGTPVPTPETPPAPVRPRAVKKTPPPPDSAGS